MRTSQEYVLPTVELDLRIMRLPWNMRDWTSGEEEFQSCEILNSCQENVIHTGQRNTEKVAEKGCGFFVLGDNKMLTEP